MNPTSIIKKYKEKVRRPSISSDKSGNIKVSESQELAPSEDSTSGVDPAAKFVVENVGVAKAIPAIRYGVLRGLSALGNKKAATTLVGDELASQVAKTQFKTGEPLLNVGWGPKQTYHASNEGKPTLSSLYSIRNRVIIILMGLIQLRIIMKFFPE